MKNVFLLSASCLASVSAAIELAYSEAPSVIHAPIQRRHDVRDPIDHDRLRRRDTVSVPLDNEETLYFANVTLGTPEQDFALQIDTGSSDLWVNAQQSSLCTRRPDICSVTGSYNANASSTYEYVNSFFNITYIDGSGALGDYATDTLTIANLTIQSLQLGIGYQSSSIQGILGLGYPINEVQVNNARLKAYDNLPAAMANTNVIGAPAYSLWLNDLDSNTGSILFGGVDAAKYNPPLQSLPIISESGIYSQFIIALTALGQNGNVGSIIDNQALPVLLDAGSSLTYLPDNIADALFTAFNAQYDASQGAAMIDCGAADQSGSIDFTFSGATISVAINELVVVSSIQNNQETCIFGVAPAGSSQPVLGDTFLRSAYVVYDLGANEISIASTNFNTTESQVMEIASPSDVPGATPVASPVTQVTGLHTGIGRIDGGQTGDQSQGAAAEVTPPPSIKYGAAVALGVGIGIGIGL
ncbi:MAG: hypothetical protein Q9162_004472 [Coniocarpon cinnabarinum]